MKKKLLTLLIGVSLILALIAVPLMSACAKEEAPPAAEKPAAEKPAAEKPAADGDAPEGFDRVLKLGYNSCFTGPEALYGLPSLTSFTIWVDEINAAGGIFADGMQQKLEIVTYDMEFDSAKAVIGAKWMVLEEKIDYGAFMGWGETSAAQQAFLTEQKTLNSTVSGYAMRPGQDYFFSAGWMFPPYQAANVQWAVDNYGDQISTAALICDERLGGLMTRVWIEPACIVNDIEIVYDKGYSPTLLDTAPTVSAIMAKDPDLVIGGCIAPEMAPLFWEQFYIQGFEGIIISLDFMLDVLTEKVPIEWFEARKSITHQPNYDHPDMPQKIRDHWDKWMARYGPGGPEDMHREFYAQDPPTWYNCYVWKQAVDATGTLDDTELINWLTSQTSLDHPMGEATWWGEEIYGISRLLVYPHTMSEIIDGKSQLVGYFDFAGWSETEYKPGVTHMDMVREVSEKWGMDFWQQAE